MTSVFVSVLVSVSPGLALVGGVVVVDVSLVFELSPLGEVVVSDVVFLVLLASGPQPTANRLRQIARTKNFFMNTPFGEKDWRW